MGSLRDREVACSASDRQGSNFEYCVWRAVSSQSSHHPQEVLLAQFSLYVHKSGLKPDSFHFFYPAKHDTLTETVKGLRYLFSNFRHHINNISVSYGDPLNYDNLKRSCTCIYRSCTCIYRIKYKLYRTSQNNIFLNGLDKILGYVWIINIFLLSFQAKCQQLNHVSTHVATRL